MNDLSAKKDDYKVSSSYLWSFIQHWSSRVISLSTFFILARVLEPRDFGIVAVSTIFIGIAEIFVDQGFGDALVQRREITDRLLNTAFYSNILMSLMAAALFYTIAPLSASYFSTPLLTPILRIMCLSFIFTGLSAVQTSMLRRNGNYRSLAVRTIAASAASGIVAIWCALQNFGVWALVWQQIIYSGIAFVALWMMGDFRPGLSVSGNDFRSLLSFGTKITSVRILDYSHTKSVDWFVGGIFGPIAVGIYSVGTRLGLILFQLLGASMADASLTHFSRIQHDRKEVYDFLEVTAERVASISGSMFAVLALNAGPIIEIVFGHKWAASAPIFAAFCVSGTLQSLTYVCVPLLSAMGRPGINLAISATKLAFIIASIFIFSRFGITYIAWASTAGTILIFAPLTITLATRAIGLAPSSLFRKLGAVYLTIAGCAIASALCSRGIETAFPKVLVSSLSYSTLFIIANFALNTQFSRIIRLLLQRIHNFLGGFYVA
ncbi:MAG: lipopolysaccharide biosynthesis protein [Formivibrio sp.]|nr:lipopolysaccharide biosynthesis protein [Formivibrio sp.]